MRSHSSTLASTSSKVALSPSQLKPRTLDTSQVNQHRSKKEQRRYSLSVDEHFFPTLPIFGITNQEIIKLISLQYGQLRLAHDGLRV
jgi:hypothetical protein